MMKNQLSAKTQFTRRLAEAGFEDFLILDRATAERVLTERRSQLIETIEADDIESVRDLSRRVERDVSIVSRDLEVLYEAGIIEYIQKGRAKKPVLAHKNIFVRPVVFEGTVFSDETGRDE